MFQGLFSCEKSNQQKLTKSGHDVKGKMYITIQLCHMKLGN